MTEQRTAFEIKDGPRVTSIYIMNPEPVVHSWLRDAVSFGGLIGTAYVLNAEMAPSGWLNFALAISWILWLAGKGWIRKNRKTAAEVRAWLNENYPDRSHSESPLS